MIQDSVLYIAVDYLNHSKTLGELVNCESYFAIERNSTDIQKQNSTLDGNPAITLSYTFVTDAPVHEPSSLEKQLAEVQGQTLPVKNDIEDIEVYKRIQNITIKYYIGCIVTYTAPKLEAKEIVAAEYLKIRKYM